MKLRPSEYVLSVFIFFLCGCDSEDPQPKCEDPPSLTIDSVIATSTCKATDGSILVFGSGGTAPLEFSIDDTNFKTGNEFTGLGPGTYNITVRDANGCSSAIQGVIEAGGSDLTASTETVEDTECFTNNGSIIVTASMGQPPYEFSIGEEFTSNNSFNELAPGTYEVIAQDALGCSISVSVSVPKGDTGTSYVSDIDPIIMNSCAIDGCHNGDNGANLDYTNFSILQSKAQAVKTRTQNGSMPQTGSITEEEKALIACWVDEGAKNN